MRRNVFDAYIRKWPQIGALLAMAMGGGSVLAASRKKPIDLRTLAVMNSVTMAAHQVEEYVDPGYFPGQVNAGIFKSDHPRTYPFNARSAAIANSSFTLLYLAPVVFPKTKWLGLPAAILGIGQAVAHWIIMPIRVRTTYAPGGFNAILLQVPIAIAYFRAVRAQGPIERSDWAKSAAVGAVFMIVGVAAPHVLGLDKNSPYAFSDKQMGSYLKSTDADQQEHG